KMDPTLAEVLLNNLLINAIKHNIPDGNIEIHLQEQQLSVRNTGQPLTEAPEDLFGRFRKGTDANQSLGLGLAIVREICAIYGFEATYSYQDPWHELTIFWKY
ncbi:MAG: sensor histidine kinase, partial [Phaeodactylibacter sp.]|nr:sensor histidine kinase [Phaeodactylibacter sp.]